MPEAGNNQNTSPTFPTTTDTNTTEDSVMRFELTEPITRKAHATRGTKRIPVAHTNRRLTLAELEERESAQPYRSRSTGSEEEILSDLSGKADIRLYDRTVLKTEGYKHNVTGAQTKEERAVALNSIPPAHKIDVMRAGFVLKSELVFDESTEDEVVWGDDLVYRVRTEIFDKGQYVVHSNMREPSQAQVENFNPQSFFIERGSSTPITRISMKLTPVVKLFDRLVDSTEGFTYNGQPVDVKNPDHLASIDPYFKRDVINAVMSATRLSLGN